MSFPSSFPFTKKANRRRTISVDHQNKNIFPKRSSVPPSLPLFSFSPAGRPIPAHGSGASASWGAPGDRIGVAVLGTPRDLFFLIGFFGGGGIGIRVFGDRISNREWSELGFVDPFIGLFRVAGFGVLDAVGHVGWHSHATVFQFEPLRSVPSDEAG